MVLTNPAGPLGYRARARRPKAHLPLAPKPPRPGRPGLRGHTVGAGQHVAPPVLSAKPGLGAAPAATKPAAQGKHAEFDPTYNNSIDLTGRKESSDLAGVDADEQAIKFDYGIDDPTNPFSRIEGLKRAYLARQKAASAGLASRGQLYSGTHERALSRTRREEEAARAELRSSYEGALRDLGDRRSAIKFGSEAERNAAFEAWLARAPESEAAADDPEAPAGEVLSAANTSHGSTNHSNVVGHAPIRSAIKRTPREKAAAYSKKVKAAHDRAEARAEKRAAVKVKPKSKPHVKKKGNH